MSCSALTDITMPKNLTSIGGSAFYGCGSLASITISANVTSIGGSTFSNCSALTTVTMQSETPPTLESDVFSNCGFVTNITTGIHVPAGKAQTYKDAWTAWADYIAEDATPAETHEHDGVTVTAWTKADSLPTEAGDYYLAADVTLTGTWTVPSGDNTLCLNGHSVTYDGSADVITVPAGASLTLTDCVESSTGRVAYTGSQIYYGVSNKGTFTLAGGAVEGG